MLLETARKAYLGKCKDCWNNLDAEIAALVTFMKQSIEKLLDRVKSYELSY